MIFQTGYKVPILIDLCGFWSKPWPPKAFRDDLRMASQAFGHPAGIGHLASGDGAGFSIGNSTASAAS
jgi:hypothetical protein